MYMQLHAHLHHTHKHTHTQTHTHTHLFNTFKHKWVSGRLKQTVREWGLEGGGGAVSVKSPPAVLTPDFSSYYESFCPLRLITTLLLLILFSRRVGMIERWKKSERQRERESKREIVCATSYWHKYLFTTRQKLATCQSVSVSLYSLPNSLFLSVLLSILQHSLV